MKNAEKVYTKNKEMATREIDNEMILMPIYKTNRDINELYTLNDSATKMWELIDGRKTLGEITDELCGQYETPREEIEADLEEFIKDMKEIKAIE